MGKINLVLGKFFCKDLLCRKRRKKVNSYSELLKSIKVYYEENVVQSELEVILIELERKKEKIKIGIDYALVFSQISLVMTVIISMLNFSFIVENNYEMRHLNEISKIEDRKNQYSIKILELNYKIETSTDSKDKEALEKYKKALQQQVSIDINNQINESSRLGDSSSRISSLSIIIGKPLFGFLVFMIFFIVYKEFSNTYKETKRNYLEDRIKIVKQIMQKF